MNASHGVAVLRERMRDPDSLVIEHVYARMNHNPDHPLLCIAYRAHNGFGGYSNDIAEYRGGQDIHSETIGHLGWCGGIERNLKTAIRKGWADITDEYVKVSSQKTEKD